MHRSRAVPASPLLIISVTLHYYPGDNLIKFPELQWDRGPFAPPNLVHAFANAVAYQVGQAS
jgi:hypothetical protein